MSQRALLGRHTRQPVAVVREHGDRVECVGLAPWFVPVILDSVRDYWEQDHATGLSPCARVLDSFHFMGSA